MAHKIICDRCGAETEMDENGFVKGVEGMGKYGYWFINELLHASIDQLPTVDLCPSCVAQYKAIRAKSNEELTAKIKSWLAKEE